MVKLLVHRASGRRTFCLGYSQNPPSADIYRHDQIVPHVEYEYVGLGQIRLAKYDDGKEIEFRIIRTGE